MLRHAKGFGDSSSRNTGVFSFVAGDQPCDGLRDVHDRYGYIAQAVHFAGEAVTS